MPLLTSRQPRPATFAWIFTIGIGCLISIGCTEAAAKKDGPAKASRPVDIVLDRMLKAYHDAKSYRDEAVIMIGVHSPTGGNAGDFDAKLEFARPNLLRMEFQPPVMMDRELTQLLVVGDGKKIYVKADGYDNQVVATDAPQNNVADKLFASLAVGKFLTDGVIGGNFVLKLLTSSDLPEPLDRDSARLLERADLEGHAYDRVEFATPNGKMTLWIDPTTSVVRRIDFPTAKLLENFPTTNLLVELRKDGSPGIEVIADLKNAQLNPTIAPDRFTWNKSDGDLFVRQLVEPPFSLEQRSKLLGQPVPEIKFTTPGGAERTTASLSGKVTVIDFWATWCSWCLKGMPLIDEVRKHYAGNDKVQFLALSEDKDDVGNQDIIDVLKRIKVDGPWARLAKEDPDALNARFEIEGIPALIVLGTDGRVQFFHVGYDPKIKENLPLVIDALLAGKDPSAQAIAAREEKLREYRRQIQAARVDQPATSNGK